MGGQDTATSTARAIARIRDVWRCLELLPSIKDCPWQYRQCLEVFEPEMALGRFGSSDGKPVPRRNIVELALDAVRELGESNEVNDPVREAAPHFTAIPFVTCASASLTPTARGGAYSREVTEPRRVERDARR